MDLNRPRSINQTVPPFKLSNGYILPEGKLTPNSLFVGGIDMKVDEDEIKEFFARYGSVREVKIIRYRGGLCKGYGFVYFSEDVNIQSIIEQQIVFMGRKLKLGPAILKEKRPPVFIHQLCRVDDSTDAGGLCSEPLHSPVHHTSMDHRPADTACQSGVFLRSQDHLEVLDIRNPALWVVFRMPSPPSPQNFKSHFSTNFIIFFSTTTLDHFLSFEAKNEKTLKFTFVLI
uniref:Deleted in azoospermia-like n=1 Tax=Oryzias melastigma TaxID=30732 RepID=A0A3B3DS64_ORYME